MNNLTALNANAFGSTFAFFTKHKATLKKIKRATKPTHQDRPTMDRPARPKKNNEPLTAPTQKWRLCAS